jgi:hypothetical protein
MNLHNTGEKHSDTYNIDFFIDIFFTLSTLGAEAMNKVLKGIDLSGEGGVCPSPVLDVPVDNPRPVEGGIRPDAATSETDDGSTVKAGTPCPIVVSSLTTSPILCFVRLGLSGFS